MARGSSVSVGRRVGILLALGGLVMAVSIVSANAHGGFVHKVHACVRNSTGAVRIVGPSATCGPNETERDWIEDVEAGFGLSGTVSPGKLTLSVDTSAIQSRVTGTCGAGSSIRVVNANGSVVCEPDTDTTYSAGPGLLLTGTEFSVNFAGTGAADTAARSDHTHGMVVEEEFVTGGVTHTTIMLPTNPEPMPGMFIELSPPDVPVPSYLVITWSARAYNTLSGSPFGVETHVLVDGEVVAETHIAQPAPGLDMWMQHAANRRVPVAAGAHTVEVSWNVFAAGGIGVAADRYLTVMVVPQG